MDGDLRFLLIAAGWIVFAVMRAMKGGAKPPARRPRRPPPEPSETPTPARPPRAEVPSSLGLPKYSAPSPGPAHRPAADDMIPRDLWETLTGVPTQPARTGTTVPEWQQGEEADGSAELDLRPEVFEEEAHSLETIEERPERQLPVRRPEPVVVSMEATQVSTRARHELFHARIERERRAEVKVARLDRVPQTSRGRVGMSRAEIRRAFVMKEVLGLPKALEE